MASEPKPETEEVKIDLFEEDDEFEEFEINGGNYPLKIDLFFLFFDNQNTYTKKFSIVGFLLYGPKLSASIFSGRRKFVLTLKKVQILFKVISFLPLFIIGDNRWI